MLNPGYTHSSCINSYYLYGKNVVSEYPMPLPGGRSDPDIKVHFDGVVPRTDDYSPNSTGRIWRKEGSNHLLRYYNRTGHMTQFLLNGNGSSIRISQSWPELRDTLFVLMNPAMAAALSLQGNIILHASSLVLNSCSILIMGESGSGKSTLSAALAAEGLSAHSDDIAVLNGSFTAPSDKSARPSISPGYPRIKIHPGLPEVLGLSDLSLIPVFMNTCEQKDDPEQASIQITKNSILEPEEWLPAEFLPGGFYTRTAPLKAVFILTDRQNKQNVPIVEQHSQMSGSMALTRHIYGRDWLNPPKFTDLKPCMHLAQALPIYRVSIPDNISLLRNSAQFLLENFIAPLFACTSQSEESA